MKKQNLNGADFGTINSQLITVFIAELINDMLTIDKNKDGKITTSEILDKAKSQFIGILNTFDGLDYAMLKNEIKDVKPNEVLDLILSFNDAFDLENDAKESIVERWTLILGHLTVLVADTVRIAKKADSSEVA